jgi:hypothetical protein
MAFRRVVSRSHLNMSGLTAVAAFVMALGLAGYPVFSHNFVSMNDVYNHVGRAPVLAHYDDVAAFRTYWIPNWRLVPYVGFDLVAVALLPWFSLGMIVKLIVAGAFVSLLGGAMLLSRAVHGKWSATTLICALLLLNRTLLAGFINYLFGIGVSLMGAAAWVALRQRRPALSVAVLAIFATTLCAIHLFACGLLGVTVVGIELAEFTRNRATISQLSRADLRQLLLACALPAIAFVPALLLVIFVAPHPGFHITYGSLASRLAAFAVPLTYAPIKEAIGVLVIAVVVLALWFTGRVQVDRRLATAAGLLVIIQLMMPDEIGTATVVDHRIPIGVWFLVVCAIDIRMEKAPLAAGFILLVASVFVSRVAIIQTEWTRDNVLYSEAHREMASLPGTARVATAYPPSGLNSATRPAVALYYMPALEFVPREGFTQILWTIPDQHPLVMRQSFQQLAEKTSPKTLWELFVTRPAHDPLSAAETEALAALKDYDYVVFLSAEPFTVVPAQMLEPVRSGPGIQIYQVQHSDRRNTTVEPKPETGHPSGA